MQELLEFSSPEGSVRPAEKFERIETRPLADVNLALRVLDAYRIKISHLYDKLSSLSNSRTRLLPHQIEATYRAAEALKPRFILADEVGLGKTVEAGLIIKELSFRRGFHRSLIITPASLTEQWRQEMKNKFNDDYRLLNRSNFHRIIADRRAHPRLITSLDFIKNPKYSEDILKRKWDIVIFDEAHRLRRDYSKVTQAYSFAVQVAERTEALFLLTATPFRGKLEELYYLIHLVDPALLGPRATFIQDYVLGEPSEAKMSALRDKISRIMLRRRKVEVGGFTKRFARTIRFELSELERMFYDETTEYVKREYNLAMREQNRAIGFIMIVFQKLLDSSTRALLKALEKRKAKMEQSLYGALLPGTDFADDWEDLAEEDPEAALDRLEEERRRARKEIRREILTLSRLIKIGRNIRQDRKLIKLNETIQLLKREGHKKFIVFTQFRTTQDYLAENLQDLSVTSFHGSLSLKEKEDAITEFKEKTEVLICTEAGGEGRNLQFASILFNYDLPWSPLKIEQRIGRIHRFGQKVDVKIFNFSTRDTVAERVLRVLEEKIKLFEQSIGPADPLLGELEDELDFQKTIMDFVSGRKSESELNQELESKMKIAESGYTKLNALVTPQCLDFDLTDYYEHTSQDRSIQNAEIEKLTEDYLVRVPGDERRLEKAKDVSPDGPEYLFRDAQGETRLATFRADTALRNENAEFLAAGHSLVDEALDFYLAPERAGTIQTLAAERELRPGYYYIFLCRFVNGMSRAELLSCLMPEAPDEAPWIPDDLLIAPGLVAPKISGEPTPPPPEMTRLAIREMEKEAAARALELQGRLHSIFKKEEYKLEINFDKKIRQLEEKLDRQKMRYNQNPRVELRAVCKRTENEIIKTSRRREIELEKARRDSRLETRVELLQVYRIV